MKKLTLLVALAMMAVMPMSADDECLFTDDLLPGQPFPRWEYDIEATIAVGTTLETSAAFVYDLVSSNPDVIAVTNENDGKKITFMALKAGTATVSYRQMGLKGDGTGATCFTEHSVVYTVEKSEPIAQFEESAKVTTGPVYQSLNDRNESFNVAFYMPTPVLSDGKIATLKKKVPVSELSFHSTHPEIAYMDVNGKLQLVAKGKTTITASWAGNESWKAAQAQIDVYVSEPLYLRVAGKRITSYNMHDIMGDGKAVYDSANHTLTLHGVNWDFEDHTINAKYGVIEYWGPCDSLILALDGTNTFTNTTVGINTKFHNGISDMGEQDLYIRSINNGVLRCTGDDKQIAVDGYIMVEAANVLIACNSRWETAVIADGMGVTNRSKVVISSEGERGVAADIPFLYLDDHVYLQGCQHVDALTSTYNYGFYTEDGEEASMVAILSAVLFNYGNADRPSNTEETTINIASASETSEDPEEEHAVITLGEEDKYNEEKQQLEIVTTLSDEEVNSALEMFAPGTEALKSMLPGSISFYIPAGSGSIQVQCETMVGYAIQVLINGMDPTSIIQSVMGWAKVDYNVDVDTYVIVYLGSKGVPATAPAYIAASRQEEPVTPGAFIKGLKISPKDVTAGMESVHNDIVRGTKLLENGQLVIISDGVKYNAQGVMMR